jgi:hypothetical protein
VRIQYRRTPNSVDGLRSCGPRWAGDGGRLPAGDVTEAVIIGVATPLDLSPGQDTSDERRLSRCPTSPGEPDGSSPRFKRDAMELVRTSGRPIAEIARELDIYDSNAR